MSSRSTCTGAASRGTSCSRRSGSTAWPAWTTSCSRCSSPMGPSASSGMMRWHPARGRTTASRQYADSSRHGQPVSRALVRFHPSMPTILIKKTGEEPGAASLSVTVPVEQVQEAEERAATAYQQRARLPGFRKGKAPAALVKRQFADDIRQQTLQELIRQSWKAALAQEALKPIADPHIHNLKWEAGAGGPVTFEFHVEVKPELTLERTGKFHLKRTAPKVTEDRVLAQLNELREQKAPWTPVVGDKPKPKDLVQVT